MPRSTADNGCDFENERSTIGRGVALLGGHLRFIGLWWVCSFLDPFLFPSQRSGIARVSFFLAVRFPKRTPHSVVE